VVAVEITDHEKCIRQLVLSVAESVKFHSSPQKVDQFIAKNAIRKKGEDISSLNKHVQSFTFSLFYFF